MSNIVYIATSLDGYIAREDGNIDCLTEIPNPENSDFGFSDFIKRIDGIIMGKNTFKIISRFDEWPYNKPVFVLSNSMDELPIKFKDRAKIVKGDLKKIINKLRDKGINNLYIDGGKTIQSFLKKDLIDELIITRVPVILGSGIPLFDIINQELMFDLIVTEIYYNGLVKSRYKRKR